MTAFDLVPVKGELNRLQDLSAADREFIVSLADIDREHVLPAGEKNRLGEISLQLQTKIEGFLTGFSFVFGVFAAMWVLIWIWDKLDG